MKPKMSNPFELFSKKYSPRIDETINLFFHRKIAASTGIRKQLYLDLREYCLRPGKRIRPLVFLASFIEYSRRNAKIDEAIKIATALELMHSFLLIQDDIIDRAMLRRGKAALHIVAKKKYSKYSHNQLIGTDIAIVMADILFAVAIEIISESKFAPIAKDSFLRIFSETYERTAFGQILDILYSRPKFVPPVEIAAEISTEKTAYYTMVYPALMGYVLSGRNDANEIEKIHDFALPLGMAFQLRDDVLGVFGKSKKTGKSSVSDIQEGKFTLLVAQTLAAISKKEAKKFIKLLSLPQKDSSDIKYIKKIMSEVGAYENSIHRIDELISMARVKLHRLSISKKGIALFEGIIDLIEMI
ncbi:MAG: polyprenyl synthetase family protein [Spirochaetes bacterium]|nr:polyprenyl synthetase family protein [Spirochaetota bacterium]